jgi:hypothetical protein
MKDWCIPFLRELFERKPEPNISTQSFEEELSVPVFCFRRLAGLFITNWSNERLTEVFGSVISDLDETDFLDLLEKNPYFFFTESLAQVRALRCVKAEAIVCVFSDRILSLSDSQIRGVLSHEIAHILCNHHTGEQNFKTKRTLEDEANERATKMGFEYEIDLVRGKRQREEDKHE